LTKAPIAYNDVVVQLAVLVLWVRCSSCIAVAAVGVPAFSFGETDAATVTAMPHRCDRGDRDNNRCLVGTKAAVSAA
jgi:hypothetical protein